MKKKKILFNIIASNKVGLGHAYRALSIANLINKNFNIYFLVKKNHYATVSKLYKKKYKIIIYKSKEEIKRILEKVDRFDSLASTMSKFLTAPKNEGEEVEKE